MGRDRTVRTTAVADPTAFKIAMNHHSTDSSSHSDLERYRPYLKFLARMNVQHFANAKIDPSDIVQTTLLKAFDQREQYRGHTESEKQAWLRSILVHTVSHKVRWLYAKRRDIRRERFIAKRIEESSCLLNRFLADEQSSPSQNVYHQERALMVANAMEALPELQRSVITMKYWRGMSTAQIAAELNQSSSTIITLRCTAESTLKSILRHV